MARQKILAPRLLALLLAAPACQDEDEEPIYLQGCEEDEVVAECMFESCPRWIYDQYDDLLICSTICYEKLDAANGGPYRFRFGDPRSTVSAVACLSENLSVADRCSMQCPIDPPSATPASSQ